MTTYEKWIDYVSGALVAFAAVVSFLTGDVLSGLLFTSILMYQIVNHVNKRQIAELREDLQAALQREREFMYRALAAETALAYEKYDNPPAGDAK
jgi:hypothetical protein